MRVAALLLHHRDAEATRAALDSLLAEPGIERVYLLDNGTGETPWPDGEPRLRAERSAENLGFSAGMNRLAARAAAEGSEALLLLNSDARLRPGALGPLSAALAVAAVAVPRVVSRGRIESCGGRIARGRILRCAEGQPEDLALVPQEVDWAPGAALLVDARCFARAGGFDQRFFAWYEDVDLSLRLRALGHRIRTVPGARVDHAGRPGQELERAYHGARGRLLLGRLHAATLGASWTWRQAARLAARALLCAARGRPAEARALLRGIRAGLIAG